MMLRISGRAFHWKLERKPLSDAAILLYFYVGFSSAPFHVGTNGTTCGPQRLSTSAGCQTVRVFKGSADSGIACDASRAVQVEPKAMRDHVVANEMKGNRNMDIIRALEQQQSSCSFSASVAWWSSLSH